MENPASPASAARVYDIQYHRFNRQFRNLDFQGNGTLSIAADGQSFRFFGQRRRAMFFNQQEAETLSAGQIWNVAARGDMVLFGTSVGKSGRKGRPFLFFCDSPEMAAEIAAQLPSTIEPEFVEAQQFRSKLEALAGPRNPWTSVTRYLIAVNVLVYVVMGCLGAGWFETGDMMAYVRYGANNGAQTTNGEWWRLVSSMFLHYGILHIGLNMWALFQVGPILERLQGKKLFSLTYFASGILGSLTSIYWHGDKTWAAGASGAIFGVIGALTGYLLREKHGLPKLVYQPLMKSMLTFVGYNLVYGLAVPNVDVSSHLGGLVSGFALGWLTAPPADFAVRERQAAPRFWVGVVVGVGAIAAGIQFSPRFDYSPLEDFEFGTVYNQEISQFSTVAKDEDGYLQGFKAGQANEEITAWAQATGIPTYERLERDFLAIAARPGLATARKRDELARLMAQNATFLRHVVAMAKFASNEQMHRLDPEEKQLSDASEQAFKDVQAAH